MDLLWRLIEAGRSFGEVIWASLFGVVTLDPPVLARGEESLGGLTPIELLLLNFKKRFAVSELPLLWVGAVIISEAVALFINFRLFFEGRFFSEVGLRRTEEQLVIVKVNSKLECVDLLLEVTLLTGVQSAQFLLGIPTGREKKKIPVVDPYALLPEDDGDEFFVSGCPYKWALFCNTCSYRFACHISLPKREIMTEQVLAEVC